jgi:hypothetical protein
MAGRPWTGAVEGRYCGKAMWLDLGPLGPDLGLTPNLNSRLCGTTRDSSGMSRYGGWLSTTPGNFGG